MNEDSSVYDCGCFPTLVAGVLSYDDSKCTRGGQGAAHVMVDGEPPMGPMGAWKVTPDPDEAAKPKDGN